MFFLKHFKNHQDTIETSCLKQQGQQQQNQCGWYLKKRQLKVSFSLLHTQTSTHVHSHLHTHIHTYMKIYLHMHTPERKREREEGWKGRMKRGNRAKLIGGVLSLILTWLFLVCVCACVCSTCVNVRR